MDTTGLMQLSNTDFRQNYESLGKNQNLFQKALLVLHLKKEKKCGSLKEQKGYSYLISQRKLKLREERALSIVLVTPPSVLDYFLTTYFLIVCPLMQSI